MILCKSYEYASCHVMESTDLAVIKTCSDKNIYPYADVMSVAAIGPCGQLQIDFLNCLGRWSDD